MPDAAPSPETFFKAFGLLSHLYLTPVLRALIEGRVPDHLDAGPLPASELAKRTGLHALTVTRSLRALAAFGAFQEISPDVVDRPEVLPDADQLLSARGVRDRCDFAGGSFFEPMATTGEVWAMCQVLHDWPDAECRAILARCRERMRETDRLLVIEMLTVPGEPNPGIAVLDMMMLLYFGEARQRTVAEYSELFRATGLEYSRVVSTSSAFSIVEARPV